MDRHVILSENDETSGSGPFGAARTRFLGLCVFAYLRTRARAHHSMCISTHADGQICLFIKERGVAVPWLFVIYMPLESAPDGVQIRASPWHDHLPEAVVARRAGRPL